ncbi:uncharacterized protein LOC124160437 [Ischnura elegans]|uniref:uncharacterized protein LOC124160437 n=1 Tax=Ischnura elegans TaxID=197161 RepID=UPI001ED8AF46|nr:uncharacterized protein LOC124160437 [Ischnura elegans]
MFIAMNSVNLKNSVDAGLDGEDSGYSEMVTRFCMPLCSRDSQVREIALETMGKTVEGWLDGYGSPKHHCPQTNQNQMSSSPPGGASCAIPSNGHCVDEVDGVGDSGATNGNVKIVPKEYLDLVMIHLPAVLRLSINCPFTDVRVKCGTILKLVEERGVPVPKPTVHGPSAYIPPDELPPLGTHNEQCKVISRVDCLTHWALNNV